MSQYIKLTNGGVFPPGTVVQTLTGNSGGAVGPDAGNNINVVGDTVTTNAVGNPGAHTLTISVTDNFASTYTTDDANFAVPVGYNLNIVGAGGITTSSAGDTVTITGAPVGVTSITGNVGGAQTGALTFSGGTSGASFDSTTPTIGLSFNYLSLPASDSLGNGAININSAPSFRFYEENLYVGPNAGNTTTTPGFAIYNLGIGKNTLSNLINGASYNTIVGSLSGTSMTQGLKNTCVGYNSMVALTVGSFNTSIGDESLKNLVDGSGNTCLGYFAGSSYNGSEASNIAINNGGIAGESNVTRIGDIGQQSVYIYGISGVDVGSTAKVVTMGSAGTANQLGTATITAGTGISVTPGANTITVAATGMGAFSWSVINADQTAVVNQGYFCNKAGTLALTLPATSAIGDTIEVSNENTALGIQFVQAAGQQILIGNTSTTLGATGTLTSSAVGDTLKIVCYTANTIWRVTSMTGNWTPA